MPNQRDDTLPLQRLKPLVASLLDGEALANPQLIELSMLLKSSQACRDYYIGMVTIDSALQTEYEALEFDNSSELPKTVFAPRQVNRLTDNRLTDNENVSKDNRRWAYGLAIVAAVLLLSIGLPSAYVIFFGERQLTVSNHNGLQFEIVSPAQFPDLQNNEVPIARIDQANDVVWRETGTSPIGALLRPGVLILPAGNLRFTLETGTQVTLRGPAELQIVDDKRLSLLSGIATMKIPKLAGQLRFSTIQGMVTNQGTQYTVHSDPAQNLVSIGVKEGQVEIEANTNPSQPISLMKNEAIRMPYNSPSVAAWGKIVDWKSAPLKDYTTFYRTGFSRWTFDELKSAESILPSTTVQETGFHSKNLDRSATVLPNSNSSPNLIASDGKFGSGIHFSASTDREVEKKSRMFAPLGVGNFQQPFTICLWFKAGEQPPEGVATLLSQELVSEQEDSVIWNLGLHRQQEAFGGLSGALQFRCPMGTLQFQDNLGDSQWHHVACVYYAQQGAESVIENARIFVDGKTHAISSFNDQLVRSFPEDQPTALHFGGSPTQPFSTDFIGDLDEVYLFDGALTVAQIQELFITGKPPAPDQLLPVHSAPVTPSSKKPL